MFGGKCLNSLQYWLYELRRMVRSGKRVQVRHNVRDTSYAAWHVRYMVFKFNKSVSSTSYAAW